MYQEINHFISMRWTKLVMEPPPEHRKDLKTRNLQEYNKIQIDLMNQLSKQIKILYPKAILHIITNEDHVDRDNLRFHRYDFAPSHLAKNYMYGLLDEPAMYIDADVLLIRKFTKKELATEFPYTYFGGISGGNFKKLAKKPIPVDVERIYNAGMVWIPKPDKKITQNMMNLHFEYFDNYDISDEASATLYTHLNEIKINGNSEINRSRAEISEQDILTHQSVHYTGYDIHWKRLCFLEYKKYSLSNHQRVS